MFARRRFCDRNRRQPSTMRSLWPCIWQVLQKWSLLVVSNILKYRVASFYVAGAAICDTLICFITCRMSLCVVGAILLHLFQKIICILRGRRSTLEKAQRLRRVVLHVFANYIVRAA